MTTIWIKFIRVVKDIDKKNIVMLALWMFIYGQVLSQPFMVKEPPTIKKSNIVLFLCDDYGIFYTNIDGREKVNTPNIDRLALNGMVLNKVFTSTAMCTPSRSMLFTGLFPHRNGAYKNHSTASNGIKSMPHFLKPLGYRVVLAGKKHIKPKEVFPFEYIQINEVEAFLKNRDDQPFCLIVASHEPHRPHETGGYDPNEIVVPPYLVDTRETRQRIADYCTDINIVDKEVGQILDILDRYKLEDNTLLIFTSDHGEPFPFAKWTCYDAGLHVPFIVRWPGKIKPGSSTDAIISFVDVLPTFIDIAGGIASENFDGSSFLPVLLNEKQTFRKFIYGTHTNLGIHQGSEYPIRAVRNDKYKYILNLNPYGTFTNQITSHEKYGVFWNSWLQKAMHDTAAAQRVINYLYRPVEELYDLDNDPYELNNLAEDPAQNRLILSMRKKLRDWMIRQNDPMVHEMKKMIRSKITIHER